MTDPKSDEDPSIGLLAITMDFESQRTLHISQCKECLTMLMKIYDHVNKDRRKAKSPE